MTETLSTFFNKKISTVCASALLALTLPALNTKTFAQDSYKASSENVEARKQFADSKFGVFIHWGIYSMFAQGEWYMQNAKIPHAEYAKAASGFYPANFDAKAWVRAIKKAGAKYICFTSRHHDGFSMFKTAESPYNIVDATPFNRDIVKELADACHEEGISLHIYYSHIDWTREDYPQGRTGHGTKDATKSNWASYYKFMNNQLREILTNYGKIGAIWFDGMWDHDEDKTPFDWQLRGQYDLIHSLQPACLVGNNHHSKPNEGEDIQIFERDVPGENNAGYSGQDISKLPLETCQTMNGMWGYKVIDQNYKSADDLIRLLVRTSTKGANLLLNVGPQPSGDIPATALERFEEIGKWTERYGETIYGTDAGEVAATAWGGTTQKGNRMFVHILDLKKANLLLPMKSKVKEAIYFDSKKAVRFKQTKDGVNLLLDKIPTEIDCVVELKLKK